MAGKRPRLKLRLLRATKRFLLRSRVDVLLAPVSGALTTAGQLSRLSRWIAENPTVQIGTDDRKSFDYSRRYELYEHIVESQQLSDFCYLEFGVSRGLSFDWWRRRVTNPATRFYGFDTFTGLPESWRHFEKGAMGTGGQTPDIEDDRCEFVKGLFSDTLPSFVAAHAGELQRRLVVHLDADLYSSTLYVLTTVAPLLKKGDILIFDEFNVPMHEFRAFADFTTAYPIDFELIGAVNSYFQVALVRT